MKKRILKAISLGLAAVLCCGLLVGCGNGQKDEKTIRVGASPSPHAEILEQIKAEVEAKGYKLEIVEYNDYVIPNTATQSGELDANFFQHKPFMDDFNKNNSGTLVSVAAIHFEPLGIYSTKVGSVEEIADGAEIGIPNDATNGARALLLLEAKGLIKLKEGALLNATVYDIVENPKNLTIREVEAAQLPRSLQDLDAAVINGNYALSGGVSEDAQIAAEDNTSVAAETYANIIAVKGGNENSEKIKVLIDALKSDTVKKYIEENYKGAVVPVF